MSLTSGRLLGAIFEAILEAALLNIYAQIRTGRINDLILSPSISIVLVFPA
jgi:hypothetical protein